jgi:hypothetical protein
MTMTLMSVIVSEAEPHFKEWVGAVGSVRIDASGCCKCKASQICSGTAVPFELPPLDQADISLAFRAMTNSRLTAS